jgi:hypothetical protein
VTRPTLSHALLAAPLVVVAAWVGLRGRATSDDPATVLAALRTAAGPTLPGTGEAMRSSEPERFDRSTLYQLIDGAADGYLARGFESCVTAEYALTSAAASDAGIAAEVYRFASPTSAMAQLEEERPRDATPVPGVAHAWADATMLVAVLGRDYLKLTVVGRDQRLPGCLGVLAADWAKGPRS